MGASWAVASPFERLHLLTIEPLNLRSNSLGVIELQAGTVCPMSMRPLQEALMASAGERAAVLDYLKAHAPHDADPLMVVAYWAAIADLARDLLQEAGEQARAKGHTWSAIGLAYGFRSPSAASRKFGRS